MKKDQYRLLFSTGVIASFFGYLSARSNFQDWLGSFEKIILCMVGVSAAFSFLYLLFFAMGLRYYPGSSKFHENDKKIMYDASILTFFIVPIMFTYSYLVTLYGKISPNDSSFGSFVAIALIVIFIVGLKYIWRGLMRILTFIFGEGSAPLQQTELSTRDKTQLRRLRQDAIFIVGLSLTMAIMPIDSTIKGFLPRAILSVPLMIGLIAWYVIIVKKRG
jgi:hypothetical protein